MTSAEDILKAASGRTRTVWVCPDAGLFAEWQQADEAYRQARKQQGGTLGDTAETERLKAEADRLAEQVDGSLVELHLQEVRPGRLRQLQADHALSKKEADKRGLRPGQLDETTFWPALASEAIVSPEFTVEQAEQLLDISATVRGPLVQALDELHGQVGDPKAAVDTARRRSGASS